MKQNKSIMESLFTNLAIILCISFLFLIFGMITYRVAMSLNIVDGLSIFAMQFYASVLQLLIIFFIFKYGGKKRNKVLKKDEKRFKVDLLDIFIFLFMGLFLNSAIFVSLAHLEIIDISPQYDTGIMQNLFDGMQITDLDKIYSFITGVILAPIVEESFFRKGVFQYCTNKGIKSRTMILISGISFGLIHSAGFIKLIGSIITGIIFAVIYATTKNVIYPIIAHSVNNLMPFIISIFRDSSGIEDVAAYIEAGYLMEIKGLIIISLILLVITGIISYIKRQTIISSDFKEGLIEIFND